MPPKKSLEPWTLDSWIIFCDENDPKNSSILSFCCGALFAFQLLPQHNRTHFCGFSGNASRDGTREKKRGFERKTSENFAKKLDRLERCNKKRLYESRKEDGVAFMDSLKMRK